MPDSGCSGGEVQYNKVSRFVREIPRELVDLGQEAQEKKKKIEEMIQADRNLAKMKMAFETKTFKPREFKVTRLLHWITKWETLSDTLNLV